jgi:outer membrane protein
MIAMPADPAMHTHVPRHHRRRCARATSFCTALAALGMFAGLILPVRVHADDGIGGCESASSDCVAVGHWNFSLALGAGLRTNPLVGGKDIPLVVIPQVSYYRERFFIDNLDLGFTLLDAGANALNLIATPGYDRVFFYRADPQNLFIGFPGGAAGPGAPVSVPPGTPGAVKAPRAPRITYLAGPEWTYGQGGMSGQLDLLRDATGQNSGAEIRGALRLALLESQGTLSANVGFTWKSAATVEYYYGVPGAYSGAAAFDPFVRLGYTLPLKGAWRIDAFAEYERLGHGIAASPLVDGHGVATVFMGAVRAF